MGDELSDAVARFVLEAGSIKKGAYKHLIFIFRFAQSGLVLAKASLRAYAKKHERCSTLPLSPQGWTR